MKFKCWRPVRGQFEHTVRWRKRQSLGRSHACGETAFGKADWKGIPTRASRAAGSLADRVDYADIIRTGCGDGIKPAAHGAFSHKAGRRCPPAAVLNGKEGTQNRDDPVAQLASSRRDRLGREPGKARLTDWTCTS